MSLLGLGVELSRLPLAAALDMWASAPAVLGAEPERELATCRALCERVVRGDESEPSDRAGWLLRAVLQRGATGLHEPTRRLLTTTLRDTSDLLAAEDADRLAQACVGEDEGLASLLVEPALHRARRDPQARHQLEDAALAAFAATPGRWREHATEPIRDALVDALCAMALAAGEAERAWTLAEAWPPGRSVLVDVAASLATAHAHGRLERLLGRYAFGGVVRSAAVDALWADAERRRDDSLAAWLAELEPSAEALARVRGCTPSPLWARRRQAVLEGWVRLDPDWLVRACAAEPDAADALDALVVAAALQQRLAAEAMRALIGVDPDRAVSRATRRLRDATRTGIAGRRELGRLRQDLQDAAQAAGEPGLADGVVALLGREMAGG